MHVVDRRRRWSRCWSMGNAACAAGDTVAPPLGLWGGGGAPAADIATAVDQAAGKLRTDTSRPYGRLVRSSGSSARSRPGGRPSAPPRRRPSPPAPSPRISTPPCSPRGSPIWRQPRRRPLRSPGVGPSGKPSTRAFTPRLRPPAINAVRAFLQSEIQPVMRTSTTSLMTSIGDEVTRVMGTPANQLALTSPPRSGHRLAGFQHAHDVAGPGRRHGSRPKRRLATTALDPGTTAPAQQVTYSTVNMMSSNDDIFRQDQFTALAAVFNGESSLKHDREGSFHVEMGAT